MKQMDANTAELIRRPGGLIGNASAMSAIAAMSQTSAPSDVGQDSGPALSRNSSTTASPTTTTT